MLLKTLRLESRSVIFDSVNQETLLPELPIVTDCYKGYLTDTSELKYLLSDTKNYRSVG